jgi:hemolysin D
MNAFSTLGDRVRKSLERFEPDETRAFMPAALEIIETPASPTGRVLGFVIILLFLIGLAWSFVGRVDIMAIAPGRLTPVGDTKVIQPLEIGVVRSILVQNGQHVHVGDLLLRLDPTQPAADDVRFGEDLARAQLDVARLRAIKAALDGGGSPRLVPPQGVPDALLAETRAATLAQWDQYQAKLAELGQQIGKAGAETGEIMAGMTKTSASIPLLTEKEKIHHDLTAQGYGTSLSYLDAQQQLSEARHDLNVQAQRLAEAKDTRNALARQRDGARAEFSADVLGDLRKSEERAGELTQEAVKAKDKLTATELRSPIDGVVDQLAVHTVGGVVTPAQHLMIVVPDNQNLIIEAELSNRDVGFVRAGQSAKVKIETFNFTRYGLLEGTVMNVSKDVIDPQEREAGGTPQSTPAISRGPHPSYVARIRLRRNTLTIDGRTEHLQPGMNVTAEIRTGTRTVIDYLLSPIARRTEESLHER